MKITHEFTFEKEMPDLLKCSEYSRKIDEMMMTMCRLIGTPDFVKFSVKEGERVIHTWQGPAPYPLEERDSHFSCDP